MGRIKSSMRKSKEGLSKWYDADTAEVTNEEPASLSSDRSVSIISLGQQPVIELTEPLVSQRPRRPEVTQRRLSRPTSGGNKMSPIRSHDTSSLSIASIDTEVSTPEDLDDAPPIPPKSNVSGSNIVSSDFNGSEQNKSLTRLSMSKGSNKPLPPLPSEDSSDQIGIGMRPGVEIVTKPKRTPPEIPRKPPEIMPRTSRRQEKKRSLDTNEPSDYSDAKSIDSLP